MRIIKIKASGQLFGTEGQNNTMSTQGIKSLVNISLIRCCSIALLLCYSIFLLPILSEAASTDTELILEQIKQLREDMNKRFEQVDKRIEFLQTILLALLAIVIGGTGYNMWQGMKVPKDLGIFIDKIQRLEIAVRELASKDPQTMEHLKRLGLL